ncbi:hypothetical protein CYJ81_03835 [Lactobacillus crispatus]|uniref:Uncharacterized protein n=1 Tax=Lactobacillus crispatus TaxID=47770 RepID=A0A5M9Z1B1_9LACO|nr:hypothetical protein [Lactobacillus crispatus]KAA8811699.1 hypothetical protein F1C09_09565 [Lactobacillus crispatus]MBW9143852.1 hypothetical protein [Lactobacillus crispatus]MDK6666147.1 hypothetical protein [Lactobacillus crispatus]MDK7320067.1 hypothetical protein [Lactobacillus crispatus]MDK8272538.1 hypothetical protein [Lactobacillus crispatus]
MNKFTSIFGKNIKAVVKYVDLDNDGEVLESTKKFEGKPKTQVEYDPSDEIAKYLNQGYVLERDGFDENPIFEEDVDEYVISFKHKHLVKEYEQKKIKQLVHYQGAASRTPEDSTTEIEFVHNQEIDAVDNHVIKDLGWKPKEQSFMIIGTPTLPGFVPDLIEAGGETVTAEDKDKEYTVNFTVNNKPSTSEQSAVVKFVDLSDQNKVIFQKNLTGQPNMQIEYDPEAEIKRLEDEGYSLVKNGFNDNGDIQFYGNADGYQPVFIITMKYSAVAVDAKHPNDAVDPDIYSKESKLTVKFVGVDDAPKDKVQTIHWNRTVTLLPSTKKVIESGRYDSDWKADKQYQDVKVPQIEDYHADMEVVKAPELSQDDQVITVSYAKNEAVKEAKAEPVHENESYTDDDSITDQPVAKQTEITKVVSDLEQNSTVKEQVAIINFIDVDNDGNSITSSGILNGKPGESINDLYSTENPLKIIARAGYHVVFNNFDKKGTVQRFNDNALMPQVFTIGVSKKAKGTDVLDKDATKKEIEKIKNDLAVSKEANPDYSKTMMDLTNVVSSLYDLVSKSE